MELPEYDTISEFVSQNDANLIQKYVQRWCTTNNGNSIYDHGNKENVEQVLWFIVDACQDYKNFHLLREVLDEYVKYAPIPRQIIPQTLEGFDLMLEYGWNPKADVILYACLEDNYVAVKWLIEHGYRNDELMFVPPNADPRTIELCHNLRIPAAYKSVCETGNCGLCKRVCIADEWQMENSRFDNMVQWFPREIVEDIIPMV